MTSNLRAGRRAGVSLLELAIALMVMTLVGLITYNSLAKQRPVFALNNTTWELLAKLRYARSISIAENVRAYVTVDNDNIIISRDTNLDGVISFNEIATHAFDPTGVQITTTSDPGRMAFTGMGRFIRVSESGASPLNYVEFLIHHPEAYKSYKIIVYANGQTKLTKDE